MSLALPPRVPPRVLVAGLVAGLAVITRPRSLGKCTLRDRYPLRESGFQYVHGHEVHADACHKARSLLAPLPSLAPGPRLPVGRQVSISWALPQALASFGFPSATLRAGCSGQALGHPSRQRLRVVPYSGSAGEPLSGYSVPSAHSHLLGHSDARVLGSQ